VSIAIKKTAVFLAVIVFSLSSIGLIAETDMSDEGDEAEDNASNPLSKTRNTDLRVQYYELDDKNDSERINYQVDGAFMATSNLKIKYEAHYWDTDVTGRSEQGMEKFSLKGIYFGKDQRSGSLEYRSAIGLEWVKDFDNDDKGIGGGSDLISPFIGVSLQFESGLVLVPLVQHFVEYSGDDVNTTAFRLIGIKAYDGGYWLKLDAKVPVDWENDNEIPANAELQFGKMFNPAFGAYLDGFAGVGDDKPYVWGVGAGVRFVY
jgi:hypothetical protein